jgi:hypothetical protein
MLVRHAFGRKPSPALRTKMRDAAPEIAAGMIARERPPVAAFGAAVPPCRRSRHHQYV